MTSRNVTEIGRDGRDIVDRLWNLSDDNQWPHDDGKQDVGRGWNNALMHVQRLANNAAHEITRLNAAIDEILAELDAVHRPQWVSEEARLAGKDPWGCTTCGAADGDWPCTTRMVADDLRKAVGR